MPDFDKLHDHARKLTELTKLGQREEGLGTWCMFVGETWKEIADMWKDTLPKETCICAAVRTPDGLIFRGHWHFDAMRVAIENSATKRVTQDMQGFITSRNRFVTRAEGAELQRLAGVKSAATGREVDGDVLTSGDLY